MKNFFNAVVYGAAVTLGSIAMTKGVRVMCDPIKRKALKKRFNNIKETFMKGEES